ncbi:MAG: hypothetical protein KDL87_18125, partial [Verrucomicrobiae bacterium]|nr:hypothetical protein [Verrucomicrobiae bacterium]
LLFWLSLFPFVTGWMGENHFTPLPTALYGAVMLMAAIAYFILQGRILADHPRDSKLVRAFGRDMKGKVSPLCYAAAIGLSFVQPWIACALYVAVAILWLVPDQRIEGVISEKED